MLRWKQPAWTEHLQSQSPQPHQPTMGTHPSHSLGLWLHWGGAALCDQLEEERKAQACFMDRPPWYVDTSQNFTQLKKHRAA